MKIILACLLFSFSIAKADLPAQPTLASDPGSKSYPYQVKQQTIDINGRKVELFLPQFPTEKVPAIVFGHGQGLKLEHYQTTFEHLARKGVAVIYPQYDNSFFDRSWERMAGDFNELTKKTLFLFQGQIDKDQVVYAGHSKGAYIALMAASSKIPKSIVLFAPAGNNMTYLSQLDPNVPLTVIWGEKDSVVSKTLQLEIYNNAPSKFKQFIEVMSYPGLSADHFLILTDSFMTFGSKSPTPFHYYGAWKWLLGAAFDIQDGSKISNQYLYGALSATSGDPQITHKIKRAWRDQ